MFQKILVPVDFSTGNKQALDIAVHLARHSKGTVSLLHVIKTIPNTEFEEFEDFYAKLESRAEQEMARLVTPYQEGPTHIEPTIMYGDRVREILQFAADNAIDLIVMNSHKIDLEDPLQGWGTISYKVGVLAQCPIMLVK